MTDRISLLLLFIFALAAHAHAQTSRPSPTPTPSLGKFDASKTGSFTSANGNFSIAMAEKPTWSSTYDAGHYSTVSEHWNFDGVKIKTGRIAFRNKFPISWVDLQNYLSDVRGAVRPSYADRKAEFPIRMGHYTGAFMHYVGKEQTMLMRIFTGNNMSYTVSVFYDNALATPELEVALMHRLDSFRITGEGPTITALAKSGLVVRPGQDTTDDYLRGRVKSVLDETAGKTKTALRKKMRQVEYDERGYYASITKYDNGVANLREDYSRPDDEQQVYLITLLRKDRVSLAMAKAMKERRGDADHDYYIENKYDEYLRLTQKYINAPNGGDATEFKYEYEGKTVTVTALTGGRDTPVYTITRIFDDKGYLTSESFAFTSIPDLATELTFKYLTFDAKSNWTSRTATEKTGNKPATTTTQYRTITYW